LQYFNETAEIEIFINCPSLLEALRGLQAYRCGRKQSLTTNRRTLQFEHIS